MNINSTWKPLRLLTTSEKMAALPRFPLISLWWNIILRACILYLHSVLLFLLLTSSSSSSSSSSHSIVPFYTRLSRDLVSESESCRRWINFKLFYFFFFLSASWQLMGCRRWPSVMRKGLRDPPAGGFSPRQAGEWAGSAVKYRPACIARVNLIYHKKETGERRWGEDEV